MPSSESRPLSKERIEKIRVPEDREFVELSDAGHAGLSIRIYKRRKRDREARGGFYMSAWLKEPGEQRRQIRKRLGVWPQTSVKEARDLWAEARTKIAKGEHPWEEKPPELVPKFADLVKEYQAYKSNLKSRREVFRIIDKYLVPHLGKKPVAEITRDDIERIVQARAQGRGLPGDIIPPRGKSKVQALAIFRQARAILTYAATQKQWIDRSPLDGMKAPEGPQERDVELSEDELSAIWSVLDQVEFPSAFAAWFRCLVLTGQRKNEVAQMRWSEIDLDNRMWTLPAARMKARQAHIVPLSLQVCDLLCGIDQIGEYVFTTKAGQKPIVPGDKFKRALDAESGVTGWRFHDLRRTIATGLARLGVSELVADKILSHSANVSTRGLSLVARTYQRHDYIEERHAALQNWADHVDKVSGQEPLSDNVVPLRSQT